MPFLSQMIGKTIHDSDGENIGTLSDILASQRKELPHPQVTALAVKRQKQIL